MDKIIENIPQKLPKIDVKDKKILVLLSENSRMQVSDISKKVKLSRDTVSYRIKRMQKLGIIKSFYPIIDFEKLGYNMYHLFLLVDEANHERIKALIDTISHHPNTYSLVEYTDRWDLELIFLAKDIKDADLIITELLGKFSDIIIERTELVVITTYSSIMLPYHFHKEIVKIKIQKKPKIDYKPDEKDLKILKILSKDCRQSTYEIANHMDLSPDAIGLRIKKMVKSSIINQFTFHRSLYLLGYSRYTFAMQVNVFDKTYESKFKEFIKDHLYITRAVKTLGAWDILVYLFANNTNEFHNTVKQLKNEFSNIVKHYATFIRYIEQAFNPMPRVLSKSVTTLKKLQNQNLYK